jgi:hypothetical protein
MPWLDKKEDFWGRTSENSVNAKFGKYGFAPILRTRNPTNGQLSPKGIMRKSGKYPKEADLSPVHS